MITLIYTSRAAATFGEAELGELLVTAREHNAAAEITGLLLYAHDGFMQQLEGPATAVDALYESILRDPRHEDVRQLARRGLPERRFDAWSMRFERIADVTPEAGDRSRISPPPFPDPAYVRDPGMAETLLGFYADEGPSPASG